MKITNLIRILLVSLITAISVSCDKDDAEPLGLHNMDTPTYSLYYGSQGGVTIIGGDGKYSFTCESPLLKAEMTHSNYIRFEALGVGSATVTISDQSGHTYILTVVISYRTEDLCVTGLEATVMGDNMTVKEQKELREKAIATIPVKVGGGYRFVFSGDKTENLQSGSVYIYPEKIGEKPVEGTFVRTAVRDEKGGFKYYEYKLHYEGNDRTFIFMYYTAPSPKSIGYVQYQFAEDLKDRFIGEYPEVEYVYSSQVIAIKVIYE